MDTAMLEPLTSLEQKLPDAKSSVEAAMMTNVSMPSASTSSSYTRADLDAVAERASRSLGEAMGNGGYVHYKNPYTPQIWDNHIMAKLMPSWMRPEHNTQFKVHEDENLRYVRMSVMISPDMLDKNRAIDYDAVLRDRLGHALGHEIANLKNLYTIEKRSAPGYFGDEARAEVVVMSREKLQKVIRYHAEQAYNRGHDQGKEDHFNDGYNEGLNTERDE